jgi:uncharacterized repeat protein (TIGR03803 family)
VSQAAQAQTFNVIYTFTAGADGAIPVAGVTLGGSGTLYGTTEQGGTSGDGAAFALKQRGSSWTLNPLHEFSGFSGSDGARPQAPLAVGPNGSLYGTTTIGGVTNGGTVFQLQPPANACKTAICYWDESVLHSFIPDDGQFPFFGKLVFDQSGNIYGTAASGGFYGGGVVYELVADSDWMFSILHNFDTVSGSGDGFTPVAGVIFDAAGNLYGTTEDGGMGQCSNGCGTIFQLMPSGSAWTESILYPFNSGASGYYPNGTLVMDQSGNLYGTTFDGGGGQGTVFILAPSGSGWAFSIAYTFSACHPYAGVTMDAAGDLYGTCSSGGADGYGMVFMLTPSGGSWTLTDLHDFTGGSDGANPSGGVVLDSSGNLYGTANLGGNLSNCNGGCGTVWEITP